MPASPRVETKSREERRTLHQARQSLNRRSFLRAWAAVFGSAAGIAAAHSLPSKAAALASEATAGKEKRKEEAPSKSLLAARCPVTGKRVSQDVSVDYMGGRLYFCSAECIDEYRANRAKYEVKANVQMVVTGQVKQTRCPLSGDEFEPKVKMKVCGVDVCFSNAKCLRDAKRASLEKRAEMVFGEGFEKAFAIHRDTGSALTGDAWECTVCGYIHVGSSPPTTCPKCAAKSSAFRPTTKRPMSK